MPNTAIAADLSRQTKAPIAVTHYFDVRRSCRDCRRPFLFFGEEQKYWYEELRFPLEADCVRCPDCRKKGQDVKALVERYNHLVGRFDRSESQTIELVEIALALTDAAVFTAKEFPRMRGLLRIIRSDGPWAELTEKPRDRMRQVA